MNRYGLTVSPWDVAVVDLDRRGGGEVGTLERWMSLSICHL